MSLKSLISALELPVEGGTLNNRWINNDIKPIEEGRRTWTFWTFHNLWVLTCMNISTYLTGSSLIGIGLTYWQAIIVIVIGSILASVFVILNSTPGRFYHIGFPVANRYVWGMYGSSFVIYNRILLSLVWYAVQAWIGGECVYVCLRAIWPNLETRIPNHMAASTGMTTAQFVSYIIFSVISLPLIWIRPHKLQNFFYVATITTIIFEVVLLVWALATMGPAGFGSTISRETPETRRDSIGWLIMYGIISIMGAISAGILNQNDYTRFAGRPRDAVTGQLASAGPYAIFSCLVGILVTAATEKRFGAPLWNLPDLLLAIIDSGGPRSRAAVFFAGIALIISQFGINVPGNSLSGGFDLAATFPKFINIRRGAYITALLSIVVNPWQLLSTASTFLAVLSAYSVFLGPMIGIMISGYYFVHRQKINVDDLFVGNSSSMYWYTYGVNWRAIVAWTCGVGPTMPGFVANVNPNVIVPQGCNRIFYINFLSGFAISSVVFVLLHRVFPAPKHDRFVANYVTWRENVDFYRDRWDAVAGPHGDVDNKSNVSSSDPESSAGRADSAVMSSGIRDRKADIDAVMEVPHAV